MKVILAIDLGTSGPKVALVTNQGEATAYDFEATPTLSLPKSGAEPSHIGRTGSAPRPGRDDSVSWFGK